MGEKMEIEEKFLAKNYEARLKNKRLIDAARLREIGQIKSKLQEDKSHLESIKSMENDIDKDKDEFNNLINNAEITKINLIQSEISNMKKSLKKYIRDDNIENDIQDVENKIIEIKQNFDNILQEKIQEIQRKKSEIEEAKKDLIKYKENQESIRKIKSHQIFIKNLENNLKNLIEK